MNAERVPVLMYHRIATPASTWERSYCVAPALFRKHVHALHAAGWKACSLRAFIDWLDGRTPLPERSLLMTFDDGFADAYEHAAPVLRELGWPAVMFLVADLIGGRDEWSVGENPDGHTYPLLDAAQIHRMQAWGWSFQSHSSRHRDLPTLDAAALADDLERARTTIAALTGEAVEHLAYPYGRHDPNVMQAAKQAGYRSAFSVQPGFNRPEVERLQIRRLDITGHDSAPSVLRKVRLGSNDGSWRHTMRYTLGGIGRRLNGLAARRRDKAA